MLRMITVVTIAILLAGCNTFVGQAPSMDAEPYRTLYLIGFGVTLLIPGTCFIVQLFSKWYSTQTRSIWHRIFKLMLIVVLAAAVLCEFTLPKTANIRHDVFFIWCGVLVQLWLVCKPWLDKQKG